jgi:hypothetical protein
VHTETNTPNTPSPKDEASTRPAEPTMWRPAPRPTGHAGHRHERVLFLAPGPSRHLPAHLQGRRITPSTHAA